MQNSSLLENAKYKRLKTELKQDSEISLAILFGSYAKGTVRPESDIDLAIKLSRPLLEEKKIALIELVAEIFGRAVDLVDLNKVGEPLLSLILKNGVIVKDNRYEYTNLAIKNVYANEDFLPYIKRALQQRREKWIK